MKKMHQELLKSSVSNGRRTLDQTTIWSNAFYTTSKKKKHDNIKH